MTRRIVLICISELDIYILQNLFKAYGNYLRFLLMFRGLPFSKRGSLHDGDGQVSYQPPDFNEIPKLMGEITSTINISNI
jgi:hypothetical protein